MEGALVNRNQGSGTRRAGPQSYPYMLSAMTVPPRPQSPNGEVDMSWETDRANAVNVARPAHQPRPDRQQLESSFQHTVCVAGTPHPTCLLLRDAPLTAPARALFPFPATPRESSSA